MSYKNDFNYKDYSELIGLIYDAAHKPELWAELLDKMDNIFQFDPASPAPELDEQVLEPHFHRAHDISQSRERLEAKNNTSNQILNRLPIGIIVTDADAQVIAINHRAEKVLKHSQALSNSNNIIQTQSPEQTRQLQVLIRAYASENYPKTGDALLIKEGDETTLSVWITAPDEHTSQLAGKHNVAIIYIASSLIQPEYSVQAIQDSFGLTASEAKLVKTLVNGCHNLNDAAKKLGLSIHTVRTQIKSTFEKTHTASQMELVKKVLTSPSAIISEAQPARKVVYHSDDTQKSVSEPMQSMKLYDGRQLSYQEYGDPAGEPVFMFHAVLGSRLQYPANEADACMQGLRMIVPDRPGHGYSDFQKNRTLLDWADDMEQLANHLDLKIFSLLAYSGGCSYALACAYKIPERIHKTVLVSFGSSFAEDNYTGVDRAVLGMARHTPALFKQLMKVLLPSLRQNPLNTLENNYSRLCFEDRAYIKNEADHKDMYAEAMIEGLRQGSDGAAHDIITMMKPLGFVTEDIIPHIRLWHGIEDKQFPLETAEKLADELPNCHATFVPRIGSMLILQCWDKILADLAVMIKSDRPAQQ